MNDSNTTITELKKIVEDFVNERDWSQFHNPKNLSMALAIEAGELMDIFKWNTQEECESMMSEKNTRQEATDELADIMIYAIAFANRNNINISNAIDQKMIKNRTVYLTFDVDGFDSSIMPATGTPEPGGIFWDETLEIIKTAIKNSNIVGADINELAPIKGFNSYNFLVAKLAYKILTYKFLQRN